MLSDDEIEIWEARLQSQLPAGLKVGQVAVD